MAKRIDSVRVTVPASTSNLGSGFDTLGLALNLYNQITIERTATEEITIASPLPETKNTTAATEMIQAAAQAFFSSAGMAPFGFTASIKGAVPVARGVGFSATIRLGIVAALNALSRAGLTQQRLLEIGTLLEGHPDNVSPALFGGFTVSGKVGDSVRCLRYPVDRRLKIVALFPTLQLRTELARAILPSEYSKADAAHNLNRSALITAAFASRDYEALEGLFDDRMHQPYREKLLPQLSPVIGAGEKAGALGGFLSGAGSGIICLTLRNGKTVAQAMQGAWPDSHLKILQPDNTGLRLR